MEIRRTGVADRRAVLALVRAAFDPGDEEVAIVKKIWESAAHLQDLDLVAVTGGRIVGHILHSRATVDGWGVIALAPVAVLPEHQRKGIGSALVEEALSRADAAGHPMVVLLGHPEYYPRFGFVEAMPLGLTYGERVDPMPPFMARPLTKYDPMIRGVFRFAWEEPNQV